MAEGQYGPLNVSLVRTLTDKLYEKRKAAALDIEKQVRELVASNQMSQVEKLLEVLSDFARSQNPNTRKGGLIGLAAAAIALGKLTEKYTNHLIPPVLDCFADADSRVRYYACEALYNIVKVAREAALIHFGLLFDTLSKLAADTDQNVRSGSELLDRLLKDIAVSSKTFQIAEFMVLLRERIHTKSSSVRRFLISWLTGLNTVPEINLLPYLPEILDGVFQILSDSQLQVREMCEAVLGQFLERLKTDRKTNVDLTDMVNVLIVHAQSTDDLVKFTALVWLREFLQIGGTKLLPYSSGYMTAILPCLRYSDEQRKDIHGVAKSTNTSLMRLIGESGAEVQKNLELDKIVDVLQNHLKHDVLQTRVAVLKWIHHLHKRMPDKVFPYMERLFPILLTMLSDASDEVFFSFSITRLILLDLEVLSDVCQEKHNVPSEKLLQQSVDLSSETKRQLSGISPYFVKFATSLLQMFRKDRALLNERGSLIIRQLCLLMKPEEIYRSLSLLLVNETDVTFISEMVKILNGILLTATEVFQLRNQLRTLDSQGCRDLFMCLYRCWSHQPVALVALCLLSQNYSHAAELIKLFTDIDVTIDLLTEIDRLVQLFESPIFAYLRLHMLDPSHQNHIAAVLYGFLMLLPQTEAFHALHRRLQCLPLTRGSDIMKDKSKSPGKGKDSIPFDQLLHHFSEVHEVHKAFTRRKHREMLSKTA